GTLENRNLFVFPVSLFLYSPTRLARVARLLVVWYCRHPLTLGSRTLEILTNPHPKQWPTPPTAAPSRTWSRGTSRAMLSCRPRQRLFPLLSSPRVSSAISSCCSMAVFLPSKARYKEDTKAPRAPVRHPLKRVDWRGLHE